MNPEEILSAAKKIFDTYYTAKGYKVDTVTEEYQLILKQTSGDVVFEGAINYFTQEDTWDEIMAGMAGDIIQSIFLVGKKGIITIPLDALGITMDVSLGTITKDLYKQYKYGPEYLRKGEFWDYLVNWEATPNDGVYNPIPYAKVKAVVNDDGSITYYKDNATGMYVFQEISKSEYDYHRVTIKAAADLIQNMEFNVQIQNSNGVLKVTLPDGTIYAQGEGSSNILTGNTKDDVLYGMGGNDQLIGGTGKDQLYGGSGNDLLIGTDGYGGDDGVADILQGGTGYDTYITGNYDAIKDDDGSGRIVFENALLTGGKANTDECNPDGSGIYHGNGGTYTLSGNGVLTFVKNGEMLRISNFRNGDLGITLTSNDPGGSCPPPPPPREPNHNPSPNTPSPNFSSPLVLDLNGDGITSTFISETSTYFDLDNDGVRQRTGWVENTDALLVLDKNQDGVINNGTELFGNNTILSNGTKAANGFDALREYDENKDGVIDNKDNIYNVLQLWQDSNSDGITDSGELHTLKELGVASINLDYSTNTDTLEERNAINQTSTFTTAEGTTQTINDVWFATESRDTAKESVTLKDSVAALPDYRGAGRTENLSTAMNSNAALETAVTALLAKSSTSNYASLLSDTKNILALWTHTDNISSTTTRGEQWIMNHNYNDPQRTGYRYQVYAYARDVAILETFWGQNFTMNVDGKTTSDVIGTEMSNYMTNAINTLTDSVLATILVQQLYGKEAYDVTTGSFDYTELFAKLDTTLSMGTTADKTTASNLLATLIHRDGLETLSRLDMAILEDSAFKTLMQFNGVNYTINADGVISGSYKDTIEGTSANDILNAPDSGTVYGGDGNDTIYGTNGTYSYGSTGNATGHEELHGGEGNDTIYGGSGSDILYGDAGNDVLYANGMREDSSYSYGHDVLIGGEGDDTLIGTLRNSTYIYNYGDGNDTIIDGGNVGLTPDILELRGIRFNDIIIENIGNDIVIRIKDIVDPNSYSGSITIKNGMSYGKIESFVFDDMTLNFDQIQYSNDVYTFTIGDGKKTIIDIGSIEGDTLQFGDGIIADNIEIKVSSTSNDLIIALKEDGKTFSQFSDKLTIKNWFNVNNRIETFTFSDGTTWDANAILAHQGTDEADTSRVFSINADTVLNMGAGNDDITSGNGADTINAGSGNDIINTGSGDDILIGGEGNDTLQGGAGNDIYVFNRGDGVDTIRDQDRYNWGFQQNAGNDTLQFGEGIHVDDLISKVASSGDDLIIGIKEDGVAFDDLRDKIILTNWFDPNNRIENFSFADGTKLGINDIIGTQATENDDIVRFANMNTDVSIHLLDGNDYLIGSNKNDTVYGDNGNDVINTGVGNDTLIGGAGNDTLNGGTGDDTYVFAKGGGVDTVIDSSGSDTLQFGVGITKNDLILQQEGNNLRVSIKEESTSIDDLSDSIVLKDWFSTSSRIENFIFSDGTSLNTPETILALIGSDSNDIFTWTESELSVSMGAGNDTVVLGSGKNTIVGGTGNDTLNGGGGNDTYIFNRGDGQDTISDIETYKPYYWSNYTDLRNGGIDSLQFADGITADDIIVKVSAGSNDVIVAIKEDGKTFAELTDKITIKNWFNSNYRIENFTFSDGTVWDVNDIFNAQGTDDADTVHLLDSTSDVSLNLGGGNDTITTAYGNDTLEGGIGNDIINASEGDDILIGGIGNDMLNGGTGNDTYVFNKGDGIDTITDAAGNDTLIFTDITVADIIVKTSANNNDLIIAIREDGKTFADLTDKITIKNWFNSNYRIENFTFSDGTVWDVNDIVNAQGTDDADTVHLLDANNDVVLNLLGGDDKVISGNGNSTIEGGRGNDTLHGGGGNDTYIFNRGDGQDSVVDDYGIDRFQFGEGITANDLIVKSVVGSNDLIVALKEDGVVFDELSDKIVIKDWYTLDSKIEQFNFHDGSILDTRGITQLQINDAGDNYLRFSEQDDTINMAKGNDTVEGDDGNDTYIYNIGDGQDTIRDISGIDTIRLGDGINADNIEVHSDNEYLIIGLKQDGVDFSDLSDKLYIKRVGLNDYGIENLEFSDGTLIDPRSLISTYDGTDGGDTINLNYLRTKNPSVSIDDNLIINAKNGLDTVIVGNGSNTIDMGDGDYETLTVGNGDNQIDMGYGWDKTLHTGDGNNLIDATQTSINIVLGEGNNTLNARGGGFVTINTGSGNNFINYGMSDYVFFNGNFGDGNNTISEEDGDYVYYGGEGYVYINTGNGDNTIQIGQKLSQDLTNEYMDRHRDITVGNGNNQISVRNGDGTLKIQTGSGNNIVEFSSDIDSVNINYESFGFVDNVEGNNTITQLADTDIENTYFNWHYDYEIDQWIQDSSLTINSYPNSVNIALGNGANSISLSDVAQDYQLHFGDGKNSITIGHENSDNNYGMTSSINVGSGDNTINVLSGDGGLNISGGSGNNRLSVSADLDNISVDFGDGNNVVEQLYAEDTDSVNNTPNTQPRLMAVAAAVYYGGEDPYGDSTIIVGPDTVNIYTGNGNNTVSITRTDSLNATFGSGDNTVSIDNTILSNLSFDGGDNYIRVDTLGESHLSISNSGNTNVSMGSGSTLLVLNEDTTNTISTGAGNDDVYTYDSNDTYLVNIGDGSDAILDMYGTDKVVFGAGITKDNLKVKIEFSDDLMNHTDNVALAEAFRNYNSDFDFTNLSNANLIIQYSDNPDDVLILADWYRSDSRIESFVFSDGTTLSDHQIVSLIGTAQDNLVLGTEGANTLHGGQGVDEIDGGLGNDTYLYNRGDSYDTFNEDGGFDTITFGNNITKNDLILQQNDNNLLISLREDGKTLNDLSDTIVINNWFDESGRIERFLFADGSSMQLDEIFNLIDSNGTTYYGTPNEDVMQGSDNGDIIMARENNDSIYGNGGDDLLFGQSGNDVLDGGSGDDMLYGGEGDDTYIIDRNMGNDFIFDQSGNDTLKFAAGISPDSIKVWCENNDLKVAVEGTELTLNDWFSTSQRIENFIFDNGTILGVNEILNTMISEGDDNVHSLEEGGSISTLAGDDTLMGGNGNDLLNGGTGNDTYLISKISGMDTIDDSSGIDTIRFGADITPDALRVTWMQGSEDIFISVNGSEQNGVLLKNWYNTYTRVEQILFDNGTIWSAQNIMNAMGSNSDDVYDGFYDQANIIHANGGNDAVCTFEFDDVVDGGEGDDALDSGAGNDTLIGGKGNDLLFGGTGNDTYVFDRDFGKDMIYDTVAEESDGGNDRIVFGEGITSEDIIVKSFENDNNLYIGLKEDGKTFDELSNIITIKDWFVSNNRIESIAFGDSSDGSLLDLMRDRASQNGDAIRALAEGGMLIGTENNDTLIGNTGDDFILGMGGDDTIISGDGNDTLIGNGGNDSLEGGGGNDIYFFEKGNGNDTIYDNATAIQEQYGYVVDDQGINRWSKIETPYSVEGGEDTLYFGDGISPDNLIVTNDGFDLLIAFKDAPADSIRIQDYYQPFNTIEFFGFSDGTIMSGAEFETLLFTPDDDSVTFVDGNDHILNGNTGNDIINGGSGNDTIDGEGGDDTLNGGFGDDMYLFGRGSGHDTITDSGIGEWWQTRSGDDTVVLKEPLTYNDLWIKTIGNDVIIGIKEDGKTFEELSDTLRIVGALNEANPFESVTFANGTNVTISELLFQNSAPEAPAETTHTLQDIRILSGEIGASDPDGDTLTYTVSSAAAHGTISVDANGVWSYNAANGYMGSDSAIISIDDGNGGIITQTLNFDVKVSAPTFSDSIFNLLEDTSTTGVLNVTNPVGGVLTYEVLTSSAKGSFSMNKIGEWNYNPTANLNGDDSVVLKVTNEYGLSTTTILSFAIEAVNDAPNVIGTAQLAAVNEDSGTITITAEQLLSNASDVDGDTLSIKNLTASSGTLIDNHDGTWSLIPSANFNGTITLNYSVSDTQIDTTAIATQYVVPVNDAPVIDANNQHFLLENTRTMGGTIAASDVDGDTLAYSVSTQAAHGVVSVDSYGNWTYKADGSFNGEDSAIVTIDDGHGGQVTSVLNFTVKGYLYEGKDLIINDNGTDTLVMTTINKEDLSFSRKNSDLVINVKNESTITLKGYFLNIQAGIKSITTAQGDISLLRDVINESQYGGYSATDSKKHLISGDDNSNWLIGNGGDDIIVAGSGYDYVNGGDGNDLLIGGSNADNLFGGNGNDTIYADDGADSVYAGAGNDELFGGNGDDTLFADDGNDTISGGAGNDTIYAGTGNDTIKGGTGNDFINGDIGSDTYLFNIGDGNDTIVDTSSYGSLDKDILVFGAGITKDNLQIIRDNYDLVLKVNDNDSVRIQYWFGSDQRNTLESIVFSDKTTLTTDQINNLAIVKGSAGSDWISGIDYMNDHIYGFAGNDGLYGYGGNDILDGGDGNDIVDGGAGNDTLIGGKGTDSLNGGSGSDTYSFSIGDGADTITDWSQYGSNDVDSITFGFGITKNDVRFMMKNGNLLIGYAQNDTINVQYAQNTQAQIEKFTLADGNYLTSNDLNVIIQSMNAYATDHGISITSLDTVKNNQALMNIVAAGWHQ